MTLNLGSRMGAALAQLYAITIFQKHHNQETASVIILLIGILNPGSPIRWRVNFELIFYMAPLLLFLEAKKNDH